MKKETANTSEYKIGNKANISNFVKLRIGLHNSIVNAHQM